jgi:two-component system, NtrC family, response regulator GlrR
MKDEKALLLGVGAVSQLGSALQTILEASFMVELHLPDSADAPEIATFPTGVDGIIQRFNPALIFLLASNDAMRAAGRLLKSIKKVAQDIPVTIVIDACEPDDVFELLKAGAADFMTAPLKAFEVLPRAWRLLQQSDHSRKLTETLRTGLGLKQLIGQSPGFLLQVEKIPLIARCEANVLITGETGSGKELYARAIHYCSSRAGGPFVPVNCGAIPVDLVENELFGHQSGAYTGAVTLQTGLIEAASGGTLLLDEIDCLPALAQVKLLRFLQEKEYRPLGSAKMRHADVRIIAASNLNLEETVASGKLRQDLYYRLNIISLNLPPLRERREDIPLLAQHFLVKYANEFANGVHEISPEALHTLMLYGWPGNVRELEHVIERGVLMCEGPILRGSDVSLGSLQSGARPESLQQAKAREIARFEKGYVEALLRVSGGNITRAALVAKKNRRAFWQLIQKHQIDVKRFKAQVA